MEYRQPFNALIFLISIHWQDDVALRLTPPLQPDNISLQSGSSLNIDQLKARNEERLQRLNELQKKAIHIGKVLFFHYLKDIDKAQASNALFKIPDRVGRSNW